MFFNCCSSGSLAKKLSENQGGTIRTDCAMGIFGKIGDKAAIDLASKFYESIAKGESVGKSFYDAVAPLELNKTIRRKQVRIFPRDGLDPMKLFLVDKPALPIEPDFENLIRDYAKIVAKECWDAPENQNVAAGQLDLDELKNDDIRLDCYVDPQLCWVEQKQDRGNFEENLIELEGSRENQLWHAFQTIRSDGNPGKAKNLVLSDSAGAGKTILTRRLARIFHQSPFRRPIGRYPRILLTFKEILAP